MIFHLVYMYILVYSQGRLKDLERAQQQVRQQLNNNIPALPPFSSALPAKNDVINLDEEDEEAEGERKGKGEDNEIVTSKEHAKRRRDENQQHPEKIPRTTEKEGERQIEHSRASPSATPLVPPPSASASASSSSSSLQFETERDRLVRTGVLTPFASLSGLEKRVRVPVVNTPPPPLPSGEKARNEKEIGVDKQTSCKTDR